MQVLGDLICIPGTTDPDLPLPWWHRAPLGLSDDTQVFVALTDIDTSKKDARQVGDLIVTVLNPNSWERMFGLECKKEDRPGLIATVFEKVSPLNIALAETVTVETNGLHHVNLICEPVSKEQNVEAEISRLRQELNSLDFIVGEPRDLSLPQITWQRTAQVHHGWLKKVKWKEAIEKKYASTIHKVDLTRVVVSADTETRVLRYVFPRHGAIAVHIKHGDEPGAVAAVTKALEECNVNILSALLRRSGGRGSDAELVAVCEPVKELTEGEIKATQEMIRKHVGEIPARFRAQARFNRGVDAAKRIYSRHPEEVVARLPENLTWAIDKLKEHFKPQIEQKQIPIFISRRFSESNNEAERIADEVRKSLLENQCFALEGVVKSGRAPVTIYEEVSSKMWMSNAGIVLVVKEADEKAPLNLNLTYELGFLVGQGKSVLLLLENIPECKKVHEAFSNWAGVGVSEFDRSVSSDNPKSINYLISRWIKDLKADWTV